MRRQTQSCVLSGFVGLLLVTGAAAVAGDDRITLVRDGRPVARIVTAKQATRSAQFAAYELQWHVKQITGAALPIVTDDVKLAGPRVLVGASRATTAIGLNASDFKKPQEYLIRLLPDVLVLMGRDADDKTKVKYDANDPFCFTTWPDFFTEHATCYAVYDFLERHCNVRWFMPHEVGMDCPKTQTLVVSGKDIRRAPAFKYRQPGHMLGNSEGYDRYTGLWNPRTHKQKYAAMDKIAWARAKKRWPNGWHYLHGKRGQVRLFLYRMRAGGEPYACNHSFYGYYDRFWKKSKHPKHAKLFERHRPELFAHGYQRQPPQMCFTNAGFLRQVVQDARDYFDGKGKPHRAMAAGDYFGLCPQDNSRWCKCPACQAQLNEAAKTRFFSNGWASDYLFGFANKVARQVRETHPGKFLSTLAYASYAYVPRIPLEPNISVQFCLHIRNVYAPGIQKNDLMLLRQWAEREKGRRFFVWLYYCFPVENAQRGGNWHCFPGFFAHQIARSFRRYYQSGVRGAFFNGFGQDVEGYVTFKLLDDPTQDVDRLLDDYFTRLYGGAAGPMKRMYLRIEQIYSDPANYPPNFERHQTRKVAWGHLGTAKRMAELGDLMDRARQAAKTDLVKRRVALWEKGVWDYMVAGHKQYLEQEGILIKKVRVPRAAKPAGGDPNKVDWSRAAVLDRWTRSSGTPTDRKLAGRIIHDGTHLYVELAEQIDSKKLRPSGTIWSGDDWEIFVARQRAVPYRQMGVNPDGLHEALAHGEPGGRKWDSGVKVVADTSAEDRWTTRLALPLQKVVPGGARPGQTIYMNFVRVSWTGGLNVHCWSPTFSGPHAPTRLAQVVLE